MHYPHVFHLCLKIQRNGNMSEIKLFLDFKIPFQGHQTQSILEEHPPHVPLYPPEGPVDKMGRDTGENLIGAFVSKFFAPKNTPLSHLLFRKAAKKSPFVGLFL